MTTLDSVDQAHRRVKPGYPWTLAYPEVGEKVTGKLLLELADMIAPVQWVHVSIETPEDLARACVEYIDIAYEQALNRLRYGTDSPEGGRGRWLRPLGHPLVRVSRT